MNQIIERLREFDENISFSLDNSEYYTKEEIRVMQWQSNQLFTAIKLLENLGQNNNIPQ